MIDNIQRRHNLSNYRSSLVLVLTININKKWTRGERILSQRNWDFMHGMYINKNII